MIIGPQESIKNHPPLDPKMAHRTLAGGYIADIVYGANDGIITTFAVVAGSHGAELSSLVVVILGLSNLVADGFSMGASNYLGIRSRLQFERRERQIEEYEIEKWPEIEREEIRQIYRLKGMKGKALDEAVHAITKNKQVWVDEMMAHEHGITPENGQSPFKHGAATFLAFLAAGSLPLVPYLIPGFGGPSSFWWASATTGATLFLVGSLRTYVTSESWWISGLEMLGIGGAAAGLAYGVGRLVSLVVSGI